MPGNQDITIHIDRKQYKVTQETMTGEQLRALPNPPISPDRDLYEEVPGPGDDIKIGNSQTVQLHDGMHFYSAPATINPGI